MAQVKAALDRQLAISELNDGVKAYDKKSQRKAENHKKVEKAMLRYVMPGEIERSKMDHNAAMFFASVYDPWDITGVRRPDLTMAPTGTQVDTMPNYGNAVDGSTSGRFIGIAVRPWPKYSVFRLNSAVDESSMTFGNVFDSPNITDFTTRFSAIRTISCGVKLIDYGRIADRGMLFYAAIVPLSWSLTAASFIALRSFPESRAIPLSDESDASIVWLPIDGGPFYEQGATDNLPFFSQWCEPSTPSNSFADIERQIVVVGYTADTTVSDTLAVEIIVNYETLPLVAYDRTVDRKVTLGSDGSLAVAASSLQGSSNSIGDVITSGLHTASSSLDRIQSWANKGVEIAGKMGGVMNTVMEGMGGKQFAFDFTNEITEAGPFFLSKKEHQIFEQFTSRGVNISPHHPYIKRLALIDDDDRIDALVGKLRADKLELEEWRASICPKLTGIRNWHKVSHDLLDRLLVKEELITTQHPLFNNFVRI